MNPTGRAVIHPTALLAAAGPWRYDQFSGHPNGDQGNDDMGDPDTRRRDSDYSGAGDPFSDDAGAGNSGGGDF